MIELMSVDLPKTEYGKKKVSKKDIDEWQKEMDAIDRTKTEKIDLNKFIING